MNVEAAALIKGVRGPKRVRGSAAGNVGELEHDVGRSYLHPMQPSAKAPQQSSPSPGDPGEEAVQTQFSEARPHYDGLHSCGFYVHAVFY